MPNKDALVKETQGYDAVYQKLTEDPALEGIEIKPEWFVNTSGPISVEQICAFYLEKTIEGDAGNFSWREKQSARDVLEAMGYQ